MMPLCCKVLRALVGKTLVTAESLTGGGIGAALTGVPGASRVFKGGIICYCDDVKNSVLGVSSHDLMLYGAVSAPVAKKMAEGARASLKADVAVSATGLAGPEGDGFGNPVGRVYLGYCDGTVSIAREYTFSGEREAVRRRACEEALKLVLEFNS